ncbi:MAG: YdcF family protein [Thermodesulfovibrionaceae bacterium]
MIVGGGSYGSGFMKEDTLNRVIAGYFIYKKIKKPIIVSGGGGVFSDAKLMAHFLKEVGVPEKDIIEEDKSRNTAENAIYVSKICKEREYKKIVLVTSGYHIRRAVKLFKNERLEIIPYPADSKIDGDYTIYSFLPKYTVFANSVKALREYIAIIFSCFY